MKTLVHYRPLGSLLPHRDRLNCLQLDSEQRSTVCPPVNVVEEGESYTITTELPGLAAEDVKVTLAHNLLTIEGEKKERCNEQNSEFHRVERSYGKFNRSFALPESVKADGVKATSRNGVLTISVPKNEQAKARTIVVEAE